MSKAPETELDQALEWCTAELGLVEVLSDNSKVHGGHESSTSRLRTANGFCYLKIHQTESHWHNEVHAYEHWASVFGNFAPKLLAVRDEPLLALVVSELPGRIVENAALSLAQERSIWRSAGAALVALHDLGPGECFGPCLRDGTCAETHPHDARDYVAVRFTADIERAIAGEYIDADDLATIRAAYDLIPAFEGERPVPCHRDYCSANWLAGDDGIWTGVIDFEFSHWDVRVADFTRDPNWAWILRPDLTEAFFEGYGHTFTSAEEQQLLVAHTEYALSAILWGRDNAFFGFEREGREALAHLSALLSNSPFEIRNS